MTNTESQILSKYKWSSTADTHQNQLSNVQIAFCAQKKSLPGCTPVNLLSLGARQLVQIHLCFYRGNVQIGSQCRSGRKGGILKMVSAAARNWLLPTTKSPCHDQLARRSWLIAPIPVHCYGGEALL